MNNLKKTLRLVKYVFLVLLAATAIGIMMPFNTREKFMNKETQIEMVDEKEEAAGFEMNEQKE